MRELFDDTSFYIALANKRDSLHARALKLSLEFETSRHIVTEAVLLELGSALSARSRRATGAAMILDLMNSADVEVVRVTSGLFHEALTLFESVIDKDWSLVDCMSFIVMREKGIIQALTADRHFTQAGFQALMRA